MRAVSVTRIAALALILAAAPVAAAGRQPAAPVAAAGQDLACRVEASGPYGRIDVFQHIGADGTHYPPQLRWQAPRRSPGVTLGLDWTADELGPPGDDALAVLDFATGRRRSGSVRLLLGRSMIVTHPDQLVIATPYRRSDPVHGVIGWGDLRRLVAGADPLLAAVVGRNGDLIAHDRIEPAWLEWPAAAVAAVGERYREALADPAARCEPLPDDALI